MTKYKCRDNTEAPLTNGKVYEGQPLPLQPHIIDIYENDEGKEGTYFLARFEEVHK